MSTTATFKIGYETFSCTGKIVLELGYTAVMPWQAMAKSENMPEFIEGETVTLQDVGLILIFRFAYFLVLGKTRRMPDVTSRISHRI